MFSQGSEILVNIRSLAVGGSGVGEVIAQNDGRSDLMGITAFVPFTAVGEQVSARVVERKERYVQAELLGIVEASSTRVTPACSLFGKCGGCEIQHIQYSEQLRVKSEMIYSALRAGKISSTDLDKVEPLIGGEPYGYRRRVSLHIDQAGKIGFYREASRQVVPTESCSVAVPAINEILAKIGPFGLIVKGKVSSLSLESDHEGVIAVMKSPYDLSVNETQAILSTAKNYFQNALLLGADKELGGYGRQILELPLSERSPITLRVPAGYFSQVNSKINSLLVQKTVEVLQIRPAVQVQDLYAGAGNFAIPLARAGAQVIAVECDKRLVALGRENAQRYSLTKNLTYVDSSVEKYLEKFNRSKQGVQVIVADPPRSGLGPMVKDLPSCEKLALISCHLPSLVRDMKNLIDRGFQLKRVIPFDMFAQTSYVEVLSLFHRA